TMHETLSWCMREPSGVPLTRLAHAIGSAAIAEAHRDLIKKHPEASLKDLDKRFRRLTVARVNRYARNTLDDPIFSRVVAVKTGTRLFWCFKNSAAIAMEGETFIPAFRHHNAYRKGKPLAIVTMHERTLDAIEEGHDRRETLRPRYL